jgi:hypothetical protein
LVLHLGRKASRRKLRLFAVGCCRRVWEPMRDETCRRAVEVAERYADRQASNREREEATRAAAVRTNLRFCTYFNLAYLVGNSQRFGYYSATAAAACANELVNGLEGPAAEAENVAQVRLLRDIFGNPFRPVAVNHAWLAWDGGTIPKLAHAVYDERAFERLPVLADALEEAGCTDAGLLTHLRGPGPHVRGCWALDLLLGKG